MQTDGWVSGALCACLPLPMGRDWRLSLLSNSNRPGARTFQAMALSPANSRRLSVRTAPAIQLVPSALLDSKDALDQGLIRCSTRSNSLAAFLRLMEPRRCLVLGEGIIPVQKIIWEPYSASYHGSARKRLPANPNPRHRGPATRLPRPPRPHPRPYPSEKLLPQLRLSGATRRRHTTRI